MKIEGRKVSSSEDRRKTGPAAVKKEGRKVSSSEDRRKKGKQQ